MCILCDARYFLLIHNIILYLKVFADRRIEEGAWEKKPRKGFRKRMKMLIEDLNSCPNLKTIYEFLLNIIKSFTKKHDDTLLRLAIENLEILSLYHGKDDREIDKKWLKEMLKKIKELDFSEWEKCHFVMKTLMQDANNFHEWFIQKIGKGDDENRHLIYIG